MRQWRFSGYLGLAGVLVTTSAFACPVCFQGNENRLAFLITTVFLSLLPLGLIGGVVYWLRRVALAGEAQAEAERSSQGESDKLGALAESS